MAIAEVEGQQFEFPDEMSEQEIGEAIRQHFATQDEIDQRTAVETETQRRVDGAPTPPIPSQLQEPMKSVVDGQVQLEQETDRRLQQPAEDDSFFGAGVIEPLGTIISGAIAEPIAGLGGLGALLIGKTPQEAEEIIKSTREAMTIQPTTQVGQENLKAIGESAPVQFVAEEFTATAKGLGSIGERAAQSLGAAVPFNLGEEAAETLRPFGGAAGETLPAAVAEYFGLKGLQKIRKGTRLLDDAGAPTKELRTALDKQGLDFDELTPEARKAIPETVDPKLLPGGSAEARASEQALVKQIKSGGKDDALAGLEVIGDKVQVDKIGKEALRQGFRPGFIQSVKVANPATKAKMKQMLGMMRRIKKSERSGLNFRPSDVVGDSVTDRIKFIRDRANTARKELNTIADTKLRGKPINTQPVLNQLQESLNDLDISLVDGPSGVPVPKFKGSLISKDKTSQRVITDVIDLLSEGGAPDALRAHKLKRQLDIMIDFNKKSAQGLTKAGKNVLKDIRRKLNESVRAVDPDYARVNDVLSKSLDSLGELDDAVGSIDIFGKGSNKALGTRMRALLSNQQGRVKIENAINSLDDTAGQLGGKFKDNVKDLVMFSDALDDRFGTVAKTSLAGQTEQAVRQATREGVPGTLLGKAAEAAGKGAEKLRGINEFNAFESMHSLLNR